MKAQKMHDWFLQVVFDTEACGQLRLIPGDVVTFCIPEARCVVEPCHLSHVRPCLPLLGG